MKFFNTELGDELLKELKTAEMEFILDIDNLIIINEIFEANFMFFYRESRKG